MGPRGWSKSSSSLEEEDAAGESSSTVSSTASSLKEIWWLRRTSSSVRSCPGSPNTTADAVRLRGSAAIAAGGRPS